MADYAEIAKIVRHHHERVDGQGYPDGLSGDEIPMIARILAVADAYNAMTSDRPYRDAMPSRVARMRLAQSVESQFDTTVVAAFEAILAGATEEYRAGARTDFNLEAQEHEAPRLQPAVAAAPLVIPTAKCSSRGRVRTPSFSNICRTCTFTVDSPRKSLSAICRFVRPSDISS